MMATQVIYSLMGEQDKLDDGHDEWDNESVSTLVKQYCFGPAVYPAVLAP